MTKSRLFATFGEVASSFDRMNCELEAKNDPDESPTDVESRLLEDDRRRGGEFLRDFIAQHRVSIEDKTDE